MILSKRFKMAERLFEENEINEEEYADLISGNEIDKKDDEIKALKEYIHYLQEKYKHLDI